jgi:hypothetical protein
MCGSPALRAHESFLACSRRTLGWADRPAEAETTDVLLNQPTTRPESFETTMRVPRVMPRGDPLRVIG